MSKARTLANFVSAGNPLADGAIAASEVTGLSTVATTGSYTDLSGTPSLGTGVATALAVNVGSAGAVVVNGGALGTPSSGTATNLTGLPNAGLVNSSITIGGTAIALGDSSNALANDITVQGLTVGRGAGAVSTNTAVGSSALLSNTTASNNTAVGYSSLRLNTTASNNAAFGYGALDANTTGATNTAMGSLALASNTTASNNTAMGYQAGYLNSTGTANTFLGTQAGYPNTTGSYNVAIGQNSLASNTTASYNTAVGYQAGYSNTTGYSNTLIGFPAGYSLTTGYLNTFVGKDSGYYVTTGAKNTILGAYNGNQGGLDIRTASNYIVLSDGDGNPRMYNNGTDWYDAAGKLRAIPQSGSTKTGSYTLATTDVGEFIQVGSGGSITVPDATFSTGDVVSIFNNTSGGITITCSITTAYIGGTDSDKSSITLATRGVATILFISGTVCVVNGNVS